MNARRILVFGNAGSGKTTLARALSQEFGLAHLCLDRIAWQAGGVRMPLAESVAALNGFIAEHANWVIEGCYGDLIEAALPHCTDLRFLNPSIETCIANARKRPWEPSYCQSPEEQARLLGPLIDFIQQYNTRDDEFSLQRHRAIFELFAGAKQEFGQ